MATLEHPDPGSAVPPSGPLLTANGARMLEAEIARLHAEREQEYSRRLRDAGLDGDNDEYLAIKEDEAVVEARIARLRDVLRNATVLDDGHESEDGLIGIGSVAVVQDVISSRVARYELVGWADGTRSGTVSAASPVGQALLGRTAGERVGVSLPDGRVRELLVLEVQDPSP